MANQPAPSNAQRILGELRKFPNLDPQAVLAIAAHEGLGGGIGDNGTSFGPFQLHQGGAYPSSAPQDPAQAQQFAWSPQGIDYALNSIAHVAGGLRGLPAIEAISTRFERPANPAAEIADAAHHYGLAAPTMASIEAPGHSPMGPAAPPMPGVQQAPSGPSDQQLQAARMLAAAVGNANQTVGLPTPPGLGNLLARAAARR